MPRCRPGWSIPCPTGLQLKARVGHHMGLGRGAPGEDAGINRAIPHNSKCRYGERGAAAAKPKVQIILCAAKVSAAGGGNSEPKQGQRSQSARGFCSRCTMRVPQPDIIEHFGNAVAVPHTEPQRGASERNRRLRRLLARRSAGAVLKPSGGNCAVLP